jgi:hypothetical protein
MLSMNLFVVGEAVSFVESKSPDRGSKARNSEEISPQSDL